LLSITGPLDYRLPDRCRVAFSKAGEDLKLVVLRATIGGNTAGSLLVEEDDVRLQGLRQEDRRLLANLKFLQAGGC
jgi:hypothetical protein